MPLVFRPEEVRVAILKRLDDRLIDRSQKQLMTMEEEDGDIWGRKKRWVAELGRDSGRGFKAEETLESLDRVHSDGRGDGLNTSYTSLVFPSALEWGGADLGARVAEKGELGDSDWGDRARWAV
ncbi:predicted protein [Histoplasma capsulatum G186AR]|uniref:Uncharacterized protein n=1 Tax=Ajellomyces capsulatus (strain G186AR / H82 / ATCC MYA-2454 / RMSCC 2432) TaxID=447093 RepID=C0NCG4_AJECG|nr:uncharacterized protein HCBG_00810 [Histoplasma capsulatum G186AR]EEH11355.1 predicted protein [Histoplasma capsulatum G186AR]